MSPTRSLVVAFVCVCVVIGFVSRAEAQTAVEVHASLSSESVEVGEMFVVELSAMAGDRIRFSDPLLRLPPGLSANGPSIGSKTLVQLGAAGTMFRRGISAKWRLVASAPGKYTIPAPSVRADGRAVTAPSALRVTVVEPGQKPAPRRNPMDPFGMGSPLDDPLSDFFKESQKKREGELIVDEPVYDLEGLGEAGRALTLARGDDPYLFLRIVPDKTRIVVGEQVTLRYLEYYRVTNERFEEHEPKLEDFLRVPLDDEPGQAQRATTAVAGRVWFVQELDRLAVFPLRAGELHTGKLSGKFRIPYLKDPAALRESNDVVLDVHEPPLDKRPPGYRIGDVGRFQLTATVTPKETIAGDTVSVSVRLEGRGILPAQLKVPERTGVEWLTPEKQDKNDLQNGQVGGSRTFGYAVRLLDQGEVDLGSIELPYFDPILGEYHVARAILGRVTVKPKTGGGGPPTATNAVDKEPFATMPKVRMTLQAFNAVRPRAPELRWFLVWLVAPSVAVLLGGLAARGLRTLRQRRDARRTEPEHLARRALAELKRENDAPNAAAIAERAVHLAIEAATGVKSRGLLLQDLSQELEARGLPAELASRAQSTLSTCASLRFKPGANADDSAPLVRDVVALVRELLHSDVEETT